MNGFIAATMLVFCFTLFIFANENEFYFVQITDTHWGENNNIKRTKSVIDSINNLPMPIEFVVHTGDVASQPMENRLFIDSMLAMMHACKYPVYYLPGNHDISFKHFPETSGAFVHNFGNLCKRIEVHGVSIITLFNFKIWDANGKTLYDPLTQLDSLLKGKPPQMPAIVFQHDPIVDDFYGNAFHPGWPSAERIAFQTLCETNNVVAVIAGHFHRDELHWLGQIPLYISAPISGKRGRQSTFRIYHYENGKLSYFTQYQ